MTDGDARAVARGAITFCSDVDASGVRPGSRMVQLSARRDGVPVARLGWEVCEDLGGVRGPVGVIGEYEVDDSAAGVALLREAQRRCVALGAVRVIGPMDGSTWQRYRFALSAGESAPGAGQAPFLLEPWNSPDRIVEFERAGFRAATFYESRLTTEFTRPGAEALAKRVARAGVTVSSLSPDCLETTLAEVWPLCRDAFSGAPYYREIDFQRFRALHLGLLTQMDPEFVLLARSAEGRLLAFVLAYPDAVVGPPPTLRRIILKTLAVTPDCPTRGVGTHLSDEVHRRAQVRGFGCVIHALMHEGNPTLRISHLHHSTLFRRYALFEWTP